jgi:putative membrane protein
MINNEYFFGGMHLIWWIIWMILLFWIFFPPYDVPGQRKRKNSPLEILQKQFASGHLTIEEYKERKLILEKDAVASNL